uniref:nuclear pore complex protein Nup214 isoform X2 n=1 Tax=Myxine glutinosa TaxID=7769 RepID=UPI00358E4608
MAENEGPPTRDARDFQFRQMKRLRILEPPDDLPRDRVSLLAVSNRFGLVFIGAPNSLRILSAAAVQNANAIGGDINEVVDGVSFLECPLAFPAQHIAISADEITLVVASAGTDGARLSFYDIRAFANTNAVTRVQPFGVMHLRSESREVVIDMVWNPAQPNLLAVCTDTGSLVLLSIGDTITTTGCLPPNTGVTAVCWSPKGKQLVCGKVNGTMTQYSQSLQEKRAIPCPPDLVENHFKVLDVKWLNTLVFIVAYVDFYGSSDASPELILVTLPKKDERTTESFVTFTGLLFGNSPERQHQFYLQYIDEWSMMVLAMAMSVEVAVIARQKGNTTPWELWNLEDACRAELPLSENGEDTLPMGIAVDTTSQISIPFGDDKMLPPAPILLLLSTEGILCPFHMINLNPSTQSIVAPAQHLCLDDARPSFSTASTPIIMSLAAVAPMANKHGPSAALSIASSSVAGDMKQLPPGYSFSQLEPSSSCKTSSTQSQANKTLVSAAHLVNTVAETGHPQAQSTPIRSLGATQGVGFLASVQPTFLKASSSVPIVAAGARPGAAVSAQISAPPFPHSPSSSQPGLRLPLASPKGAKSLVANVKSNGPTPQDPYALGIAEEITQFKEELRQLEQRAASADVIVGSRDELTELRAHTQDFHSFFSEIKGTVEWLHADVLGLKAEVLQGFVEAEELRQRRARSQDRDYMELLQRRPLDPYSARQLKEIVCLSQNVMLTLEEVNMILDSQWESHLESQKEIKRLNPPEREILYHTLETNQAILGGLHQQVETITQKLQQLRLYQQPIQVGHRPGNLTDPSNSSTWEDLGALRKAINSCSVTSRHATEAVQDKKAQTRQAQLRAFLSSRTTIPVKATAPANLSRSAFLSSHQDNDVEEINSLSSVGLAEPLPLDTAVPQMALRPTTSADISSPSTASTYGTHPNGAWSVPGQTLVSQPLTSIPPQQAAAASNVSCMSRDAGDDSQVSISLTETALKAVPKVVNAKELTTSSPVSSTTSPHAMKNLATKQSTTSVSKPTTTTSWDVGQTKSTIKPSVPAKTNQQSVKIPISSAFTSQAAETTKASTWMLTTNPPSETIPKSIAEDIPTHNCVASTNALASLNTDGCANPSPQNLPALQLAPQPSVITVSAPKEMSQVTSDSELHQHYADAEPALLDTPQPPFVPVAQTAFPQMQQTSQSTLGTTESQRDIGFNNENDKFQTLSTNLTIAQSTPVVLAEPVTTTSITAASVPPFNVAFSSSAANVPFVSATSSQSMVFASTSPAVPAPTSLAETSVTANIPSSLSMATSSTISFTTVGTTSTPALSFNTTASSPSSEALNSTNATTAPIPPAPVAGVTFATLPSQDGAVLNVSTSSSPAINNQPVSTSVVGSPFLPASSSGGMVAPNPPSVTSGATTGSSVPFGLISGSATSMAGNLLEINVPANTIAASPFSANTSTSSAALFGGSAVFAKSMAGVEGFATTGQGVPGRSFTDSSAFSPGNVFCQPAGVGGFGQAAPATMAPTSVFGAMSSSGAPTTGFFGGLGGQPSQEAATKNPFGQPSFGSTPSTGTATLFGASGAKDFSFSNQSMPGFGEIKNSNSFSTRPAGSSVANQGFAAVINSPKLSGFGGAPTFGGLSAIAGAATFGGGSPGKIFGETTTSPPNFGFCGTVSSPTFGSLASQASTMSSFSSVGQQSSAGGFGQAPSFGGTGSAFGAQNAGGFGGFGGFASPGFGQASTSNPNFFTWRS